jgi:hypothetical protein
MGKGFSDHAKLQQVILCFFNIRLFKFLTLQINKPIVFLSVFNIQTKQFLCNILIDKYILLGAFEENL